MAKPKIYLCNPDEQGANILKKRLQESALFVLESEASGAQHLILVTRIMDEQAQRKVEAIASDLGDKQRLIICVEAPFERAHKHCCVVPPAWSPLDIADRIEAELALFLPKKVTHFGKLIGISPQAKKEHHRIEKFAPGNDPVLFIGPTGSGKTVAAKELHRRSGNRGQLLEVNSSEFSGDMANSDLFGHEGGSFTGAEESREGLIRSATSTLFLDEIGDMDMSVQARLLKVVEEMKVRSVGHDRYTKIQTRFLYATKRDLEEMNKERTFRQDLYYRINENDILISPLQERRVDILLMARHFLTEWNEEKSEQLELSDICKDALFRYEWPGNTRQLRSLIRKVAKLSDAGAFADQELLDNIKPGEQRTVLDDQANLNPEGGQTWDEAQNELKSAFFRRLLAAYPSKKEAAVKAEISRARMYEIAKELGL